jgi:DNA replication protein DnaC
MRTRNGGLLLYGPVGTGKTHLAAAIVRAAVEAGSGAVFCRAADVYRALRDTFDGQQKEGSIIDRLTGAELLVLDDVAAGSLSDFERRTTLEIIDRRISAQLPSVVTTNWTVDEIARKMDERIASRLAGFTSVAFTGCDRRAGGCEA